jgi:hypothetical protein
VGGGGAGSGFKVVLDGTTGAAAVVGVSTVDVVITEALVVVVVESRPDGR